MKTSKFIITLITTVSIFGIAAFAADEIPKEYPLQSCVVSGERLVGDMGMTPYKVTYEGADVWLCCKACKRKFDADPAKYTKTVKDATK